MKSKPRVTVITIFLNAERFIREAVESVLAQSYRQWELLLVDDGSTDGSTDAARGYAVEYPQKVRYLHHPGHDNRGISASQNLGISEARGEYIAFLDADDVWEAEKLTQQVAIMESHPEAAMVYGATRYWYSWTGNPEDAQRDLFINPGIQPNTLVSPPELLIRFLRQEVPIPCPSDIMVRRNKVIDVGGFEESFRRIFTDQVFYSKLCLKWPVVVSDQSWFKYRKHSDSAVSVVKKTGQLRSARLNYLNWLERYLREHEIKDREVRRALLSARLKCLYPRLSRLPAHIKYRALILRETLRSIARRTLPASARRRLRAKRKIESGGQADGRSILSRPDPHLASVIIPCYNQGRFLGEAIESILTQSYPNHEVIVVDDGSTDDTARVATSYEGVRCLKQKNRGLAAARNAGLEASRGSYAVFLDADDRLLPNALEDGVSSLIAHPECAFAYGHVKLIAADGSALFSPKQFGVQGDHYLELLRGNYIWTPGAVIYRRAVVDSVGGFNTAISGSADFDLNARIARLFPICCTETAVLEYRRHENSMSRDFATMLRAAVTARRLQWKFVKGSRQYEKALQDGIQVVQKDYGGKLIAQARNRMREHRWREAMAGLLTLIRYYPRGLLKEVYRKAHHVVFDAQN